MPVPLFTWKGIRIDGTICSGSLFATSKDELDKRLLKQQIALLSCNKKIIWFRSAVRQPVKIQFFKELSLLLKTGILLPEALHILEMQLNHLTLQEVVQQLQAHIVKGVLLHAAMREQPHLFDAFMIQMVQVGHENGDLAHALQILSNYLESNYTFQKKLRSLALAPISTLIFFLLIAFIIFVFIVPQFASLFTASRKTLPRSTQMMLSIAEWLRSLYVPLTVLFFVLFGLLMHRWLKTKRSQRIKAKLLCGVPFVGNLIRYNSTAHFFQAVSLLLDGGIPLVTALHIVQESLDNILLVDVLVMVEEDIRSGSSFSQALFATDSPFFEYNTVSMLVIGEESGYLSQVTERVAQMYRDKVQRSLSIIGTLFQPMLLVILGLLVALLVFSVYLPLFNLSHVIPV